MTVTRRNILAAASAGAGSFILVACSGSAGSKSAATESAARAGADQADPTPATTSSPSAVASRGSATTGNDAVNGANAGAAKIGAVLAELSAVPVGGAVSATGKDGAKLIVAQPTKGTVVAFSAICTHQGCTVAPAKSTLNCPCHGSVFNTATGAVTSGPAPSPLPKVAVMISGSNIVQS